MSKKQNWLLLIPAVIILCATFLFSVDGFASSDNYFSSDNAINTSVQHPEHPVQPEHGDGMAEVHQAEHHDEGGGHHGPDTSGLFFIIIAVSQPRYCMASQTFFFRMLRGFSW